MKVISSPKNKMREKTDKQTILLFSIVSFGEQHSKTKELTSAGIKTNKEYPYRQNNWTSPDGAEKYLRITYKARGTTVT